MCSFTLRLMLTTSQNSKQKFRVGQFCEFVMLTCTKLRTKPAPGFVKPDFLVRLNKTWARFCLTTRITKTSTQPKSWSRLSRTGGIQSKNLVDAINLVQARSIVAITPSLRHLHTLAGDLWTCYYDYYYRLGLLIIIIMYYSHASFLS